MIICSKNVNIFCRIIIGQQGFSRAKSYSYFDFKYFLGFTILFNTSMIGNFPLEFLYFFFFGAHNSSTIEFKSSFMKFLLSLLEAIENILLDKLDFILYSLIHSDFIKGTSIIKYKCIRKSSPFFKTHFFIETLSSFII